MKIARLLTGNRKLMKNKKFILDACCGGKTIWFEKNHPNVLYVDIRKARRGVVKVRPNFCVEPDRLMDFRNLKLRNRSFKLVVFDPPHLSDLGKRSEWKKKYGNLNKDTWESDIRRGFNECWRVLKRHGILIFKWNEHEIPTSKILSLIPHRPLFGHKSGKLSKTHWLCFMKIT